MTQYDPEARIWSAQPRPPVLNPCASVGQVLLNVLERTPDKVAQINADTDTRLTCDELRRRSIRFALFLKDGLSGGATGEEGDPVVLIARNSDNVAPVAFGCFLAGIPIGTLDPAFSSDEILHMLGIMRPRAVITDRQTLPSVREAIDRAGLQLEFGKLGVLQMADDELDVPQCYSIDDLLFGKASDAEDAYVPPYLGDSERRTAAIVCSSGTTGMPKAVRISHAQLIAPYQRISQLDRADTILCFSTLYWISGLQMLMTGVLNGIRRIITSQPGAAAYAIELCQRYDVTVLLVTPSLAADVVRRLADRGDRLRSLKLFAVGGSQVPVALRDAINQRALVAGRGRCFVGYGMSEAGPVAYEYVPRADSVGFLTPGVKAKIVDAEGRLLGPNEPGELLVRPAHPFLGYYRDPLATAGALDEAGFVRTGDIARFDTDGFLFLVERMKEIFKVGGRQVAPAELEGAIGELPGVRRVVVVGVPDPAAPFDDIATALIVRAGGPAGETLSAQRVLEQLEERIVAEHKRLRGGVIFVDQLPMTANGKVKRSSAKQLAVEKYFRNNITPASI